MSELVQVYLSREEMKELLGIENRGQLAIERIDISFSPMADEWTVAAEIQAENET